MNEVEWTEQRGAGDQVYYVAKHGDLGLRVYSLEEGNMGWTASVSGANWEVGINLPTEAQAKLAAIVAAPSALTLVCGIVMQLQSATQQGDFDGG